MKKMTTVYMKHEGHTNAIRTDIPASCAAMVLQEKAHDYARSGWIVSHDSVNNTVAITSRNPLQSGVEFWY